MSHPDPGYDPENSYEDDEMSNYDYSDDFYSENEDYNDYYIEENDAYEDEDENEDVDNFNDSMDGDHESGLASAGYGTDEDYGYYGDDYREDFHADEAVGFVDYNEDGPYDD